MGATPTRIITSTLHASHLSRSITTRLWQGKPRWGIGVAISPITRYEVAPFSFGWYSDWRAQLDPPRGVDILPGFDDATGVLYEVNDSGNLDAFRRQIIAFREWMAVRGFQNYPLIVSEYGIPMPEDYGFPDERVLNFLIGTFDFFLNARDPALGYPADDYKLVQRWCWYSLDDTGYPTDRLFDPQTGARTNFGKEFAAFVRVLIGQ